MTRQREILLFVVCLLRCCDQISSATELIFDKQLVMVTNDCYTRVAIGSRLPDIDVFASVAVAGVSECEDECSKRDSCDAFALGIDTAGNGTCALSSKTPRLEDLQSHADYDVYVKSQPTPHCEPERLDKIGMDGIRRQEGKNETRPKTGFGNGLLPPTMPSVSSPGTMGTVMPNVTDGPSYQQNYTPSVDEEHYVSDNVGNRNPMPSAGNPLEANNHDLPIPANWKPIFGQRIHPYPTYQFRPTDFGGSPFRHPFSDVGRLNYPSNFGSNLYSYQYVFTTVHDEPFGNLPRPIFIHDEPSKSEAPADFGLWTAHDPTKHRDAAGTGLDRHRDQGFFFSDASREDSAAKRDGLITDGYEVAAGFRPVVDNPLYGFGEEIPSVDFRDFSETWRPGQPFAASRRFGQTGRPKSCYRRLLAGKKSLDLHVRRAFECEGLEECERACDYEKLFACGGFNYRRVGHGTRGTCELTSMPRSRMDLRRDFLSDPRCDYYEKDPNCVTTPPGTTSPTWWNQQPKPSQSYGPPYYTNGRPGVRPQLPNRRPPLDEVPRPFDYDRRPSKEVPRPLDFDRRPSNDIPRPFDYDRRPSKEVPRPLDFDRRPSNDIPRPLDFDRRPSNDIPRPLDFDRRPSNDIPRPLDFDRRPSNGVPRPLDYHDLRPPPIYGAPHRGAYGETLNRQVYQDGSDSSRDGYPRPEDRFTYGGRSPPRRLMDNDFYSRDLPWRRQPGRRIDHGPPQDIGTNEIGSYLPDRRKDRNDDWRPYGAVYGGSYGYDTNYYDGKLDVPKYHPHAQESGLKPPRPYENDHFYGEFYNYGGAFGYGDSYIPADQDPIYGTGHTGTGRTEECSVRAGAGFRLSRGVVRATHLTPSLDQCESLCINEKSYACMSFSYRYNVAPTDPTDNCLLSDVSYKDLNFYVDLEPDRNYDIYAMIVNSRTCGTRGETSPHPPDECFWRVRSGFGMPTEVVSKSMLVDNLGQCQAQCTIAQDFTCRSFAFKYMPELGKINDVSANCYLSDWPSQDINPAQMPDMDGAELYERGSFGRGCELYAVPFFNTGRAINGKQSVQEEEGDTFCYSEYNRPCKLTPYAVLLATYVNSEQDCRQKCSKMRETDSVPCMSYSYKLTTHGTEENCLLSDVPTRDLRPGLDYTYDDDHVLYAWKDLDPYCVVTGYSIDDDRVFGVPGSGTRPLMPGFAASRPDFGSGLDHPSAKPHPASRPDPRPFFTIMPKPPGGHYHGVRPFDPDKPDPIEAYHPDGVHGGHGIRPGGLGQGLGTSHPTNEYSNTFSYYTVNGHPCKRGTRCERNKLAGFWTCETEGGEYGSWDYCCAPTHHCGFSQGYHYPWCYVGSSEDQWRPCSEKYYPYLPSPRPMRPATSPTGHNRPDPGYYYGRHWPITYLHGESPPNCTDSIASADDSGDRRANRTTSTTTVKPSSSTTLRDDEENGVVASTTNRTRPHPQRLRVRNDRDRDRESLPRRRIDSSSPPSRTAKIERVPRPTTTTTTYDVANDGSERVMIRVPLIASNDTAVGSSGRTTSA